MPFSFSVVSVIGAMVIVIRLMNFSKAFPNCMSEVKVFDVSVIPLIQVEETPCSMGNMSWKKASLHIDCTGLIRRSISSVIVSLGS